MSQQPQKIDEDEPADERLTQLVSYLDGELDDTQMDQIEQSLINDPDMRSHADILSRTWAMLDSLEDVAASKKFTQATLETVSTEAVTEKQNSSTSVFRRAVTACARYKILPCFLAGVIGASAGLMATDRMQQKRQQSEEVATDAFVLENLDVLLKDDLYREVPNVAKLKSLRLESGNSRDVKETP